MMTYSKPIVARANVSAEASTCCGVSVRSGPLGLSTQQRNPLCPMFPNRTFPGARDFEASTPVAFVGIYAHSG